MMPPLARRLETRLAVTAGLALLMFSVIAGIFTYRQTYRQQLELAASLQGQLVATVQIQAEVAAFAINKEIAQGVLNGLLANTNILAARIEAVDGFKVDQGKVPGAGGNPGTVYPLFSPIDKNRKIGTLVVVQNDEGVAETATRTAVFQTGLMLMQVLIAVVIMTAFVRIMMIRPLARLARAMVAISPGSSIRLDIAAKHAADEIGLLSNSANAMLDAAETRTLELERANESLAAREAAIRLERDANRNLLETVEAIIVVIDLRGCISLLNRKGCQLLGYGEAELIGKDWFDVCLPPSIDKNQIREVFRKAIACDLAGSEYYENAVITRSGEERLVAWHNSTIRDKEGRVIGALAAGEDITERKHYEVALEAAKEAAEHASLAKSRFLAAASHDLRQPIQALDLFLHALNGLGLSKEQQKFVDHLSLSAQSVGEILDALLDISKLDSGMVKPLPEAIPVVSFFGKIDAEFSPLASAKSLRFKLSFPQKDMFVFSDARLFQRLLWNLVGNAIKYTRQGGVLVGIRRRGGQALVQVWDTGIGIAPEHLGSIFEEYFQVGNHERDKAKGLGLGLSIVRRLARLLGTEVLCRSRPGKGSVFEFRLPLAADADSAATMNP